MKIIFSVLLVLCCLGAICFITENDYPRPRKPVTKAHDVFDLCLCTLVLVVIWI